MAAELKHDGDRFVFIGGYEDRHLPKSAGFRWDPKRKQWWTKDQQIASKLANYADAATQRRFQQAKEEVNASRATDAEIVIPAPEGLEYMPFQRAGIAYAVRRESTLIGDEMGLGKTIQALGVINATPDAAKVLVICPASLRLNWKQEAAKWLVRNMRVGVVDPKTPPNGVDDVVIINYDILGKHQAFLHSRTWDFLIVDEAHALKNPKAKRTRLVLGNWKDKLEPIPAKRKLFLTGTPILNRPIEIQPVLGAIHEDYAHFFRFARRYCGAHRSQWGWDFSGASNLGELQEGLRSKCMVRRLKADVLTELPAKRRSVIEIPANGKSRLIDAELKAMQKHEAMLDELRVAVELAKASDDPAEYEDAVQRLKEGAQASFVEISELRKKTAVAKAPLVAAHVKDATDAGHKVVVFAHHHEVIDLLFDELSAAGVVKLDGRDDMDARNNAVNRFQNDDTVRVFIGGIHAAGVGLTLTASSHVVFAELDWVPGNVCQAEDRCHRIGQQDQVLIQHLVLEGSIDAQMAKTLLGKQAVIDKALDAEVKMEPIVVTAPEPVAQVSPRRSELERSAKTLDAEDIAIIHHKLRLLAAWCDGANALDGRGFNKIDARIGHSLAGASHLTPKQAALGKKIVRKYHAQLNDIDI